MTVSRPSRRCLVAALLVGASASAFTYNDPNPATGVDLVINTSLASVNVAEGVTISASGTDTNYALHIVYPGSPVTVGKLTISGTVTSANDAGLTLRQLDTVTHLLVNPTGRITGGWYGLYNEWNGATFSTITNLGYISSSLNEGVFGTVNNLQGGDAGPLVLDGNLPAAYNVIIRGAAYGQARFGGGGALTFGIYGGDAAEGIAASSVLTGVYRDVLMNIDTSQIDNARVGGAILGSYGATVWRLQDATYREGSQFDWDLLVFNYGADLAAPQREMLERRQVGLREALRYDCDQFGPSGVGVTFRARRSSRADEDESAGVLTVARRLGDRARVGAFLDHRGTEQTSDGVRLRTGHPLVGFFAAYEAARDGTGFQARLAAAGEKATADISHLNLAGSASAVNERAAVDSVGVEQRLAWGFATAPGHVLTPYLGVRYAEARRRAYAETLDPGVVDDPMRFGVYGDRRTTGTLGLEFAGAAGKSVSYRLGAGLEHDMSSELNDFTVASDMLGASSYSTAPARRTRWVAGAGAGVLVDTARELSLEASASQPDFGRRAAFSVMLGYHMGF